MARNNPPVTKRTRTSQRLNQLEEKQRFPKPFPIKTSMLPETEFPQTIHIWTDGSKQIDNKMGYAAMIINKCTDNISRKSHRIEGPPSSTRPELYAIMAGILNCPTNAKITIFTDSQNAIENINKIFTQSFWNDRQIIKLVNLDIYDLLYKININFKGTLEFVKVKAHTGIKLNEEADQLAKQACSSKYIEEIPSYKSRRPLFYVHINGKMIPRFLVAQPNRA